jgi:hypothetical protein
MHVHAVFTVMYDYAMFTVMFLETLHVIKSYLSIKYKLGCLTKGYRSI